EIMYSSGLRISEVCGLKAEDLDLREQLVRVRGKGRKERIVPVGTHAIARVQEYWGVLERAPAPGEPVFWRSARDARAIPARTIQHRLKEYLRAAGLDPSLSPHKLRHSFAT